MVLTKNQGPALLLVRIEVFTPDRFKMVFDQE